MIIWRGARNYAPGDESVTERLREVYEGTMTEDQPLLEAIQATTGGAIGYQVSAAADAAAIRAYQIVEALLAEEAAGPTRAGAATETVAVPFAADRRYLGNFSAERSIARAPAARFAQRCPRPPRVPAAGQYAAVPPSTL